MVNLPVILKIHVPYRLIVEQRIVPIDVAIAGQAEQEVSPGRTIGGKRAAARCARTQTETGWLVAIAVERIELRPLTRKAEGPICIISDRTVDGISIGVIENPSAEVKTVGSFCLGKVSIKRNAEGIVRGLTCDQDDRKMELERRKAEGL